MAKRADDVFSAIVKRYPLREPLRIEREESGMNNTTRMIYAANGRFVLRIYDNHRDSAIAGIEHAILSTLQEEGLSFKVPNPAVNREGMTITKGPDAKLAAVFRYIAGDRPTAEIPSHIEGLGRAAGELVHCLAKLDTLGALQPLYKPYYEFQETHAAMDDDAIRTLSAKLPLTSEQRDNVDCLLLVKRRLTSLIDRIRALPHQWVHGDIVFSNALADGDFIVGLLDFEFCTVDVRAMEAAVMIAEFPSADDAQALERISLLCRGFGEKQRLGSDEIGLLPDLIQLRMMDVWLHFAGRLSEGLDSADVWLHQIDRVSFVCEWVERKRAELYMAFRVMEARPLD
ncbi:phosphotransferase [Paenibacillus sacheonensis]|uniref:Phosphotransferase n=1 Tax=Paenibacillus sacheonensis TaxID=742054 RepID=A0A7X5BV74_9BACL|nr:phosphotransferase [Paenibacillus sacheonensis]MBM7563325.1 homoserine kinase type II [Paenibacillus sacheonensis]NBC68118.1 phosphotransferase [Paenibacillus sacheonensis]